MATDSTNSHGSSIMPKLTFVPELHARVDAIVATSYEGCSNLLMKDLYELVSDAWHAGYKAGLHFAHLAED